ncbi:hypothetical protein H6501_03480 [Candidatus Woesearchaeota archaeon]|nr:hypothetical protein [Nanoarchaeota archaeon]MCB9370631.1 hypothetical protein [Candidatus Woesearchaeota archaeon]USN43715.1 MAG: hypothetical protein H6500_04980 [Candidatus Woesearchaeota archaeon]
MTKIIVVGEEEFTLGFELVGIESKALSELETLMSGKEDVGIIILSQKDYETLSVRVKNAITKLLKPIVVIISEEDQKGNSLREQIIRTMGVDLLK